MKQPAEQDAAVKEPRVGGPGGYWVRELEAHELPSRFSRV